MPMLLSIPEVETTTLDIRESYLQNSNPSGGRKLRGGEVENFGCGYDFASGELEVGKLEIGG
jgi:hypothetical protein